MECLCCPSGWDLVRIVYEMMIKTTTGTGISRAGRIYQIKCFGFAEPRFLLYD